MKSLILPISVVVLASVLSACGPTTSGTTRSATILGLTGVAASGNTNFTKTCALGGCHSSTETKQEQKVSYLVTQVKSNATQVVDIILNGKPGTLMTKQDQLTNQEIADIVAYLKSM